MLGEGLGSKALQRAAGPAAERDEVGVGSADGKHHPISSTLVMRKIQDVDSGSVAWRRNPRPVSFVIATLLLEGRGTLGLPRRCCVIVVYVYNLKCCFPFGNPSFSSSNSLALACAVQ